MYTAEVRTLLRIFYRYLPIRPLVEPIQFSKMLIEKMDNRSQ